MSIWRPAPSQGKKERKKKSLTQTASPGNGWKDYLVEQRHPFVNKNPSSPWHRVVAGKTQTLPAAPRTAPDANGVCVKQRAPPAVQVPPKPVPLGAPSPFMGQIQRWKMSLGMMQPQNGKRLLCFYREESNLLTASVCLGQLGRQQTNLYCLWATTRFGIIYYSNLAHSDWYTCFQLRKRIQHLVLEFTSMVTVHGMW